MAREFKEVAMLRTDLEKYQRAYDHVFNKAKCPCVECEEARNNAGAICKDQNEQDAS